MLTREDAVWLVELETAEALDECLAVVRERWPALGDFPLKVKLSFARSRTRSWGGWRDGKPFVSLCLDWLLEMPLRREFREYASFADDPEIGSFWGNWRECLRALVAHEVAHAVCGALARTEQAAAWPDLRTAHGNGWREVYRILRAELLAVG